MKFKLIEDINSSLENEYDELQGYLSSTINKVNYRQLKQSASRSTTPMSRVSTSYPRSSYGSVYF